MAGEEKGEGSGCRGEAGGQARAAAARGRGRAGSGSRAAWGIFGPGYLKPPDFRVVPFCPLASLPWGGDAAAWAPVPVGERARSALSGTGKRRSYPTSSGSGRPRKVVSPASWTGSARGGVGAPLAGGKGGPGRLRRALRGDGRPCEEPVAQPRPSPVCVFGAPLPGCSARGLGTRAAETFPGNGRRAACLIMR